MELNTSLPKMTLRIDVAFTMTNSITILLVVPLSPTLTSNLPTPLRYKVLQVNAKMGYGVNPYPVAPL